MLNPQASGLINNAPQFPVWDASSLLSYPVSTTSPAGLEGLVWDGDSFSNLPLQTVSQSPITISRYNSIVVSVTAGSVETTIGSPRVVKLTSSMIKSLIGTEWQAGTNQTGRMTASLTNNTTYHVFAMCSPTGVGDIGLDTSIVAANRPSGWSARRIGSIIYRNNDILNFTQIGHYFELKAVSVDIDNTAISTISQLYTLTVPSGVKVWVDGVLSAGGAVAGGSLAVAVGSPDQILTAANTPNQTGFRGVVGSYGPAYYTTSVARLIIPTNTSAQIQILRSGAYFGSTLQTTWQTVGWYDFSLLLGD